MFQDLLATLLVWLACGFIGFVCGFLASAKPKFSQFSPLSRKVEDAQAEVKRLREEIQKLEAAEPDADTKELFEVIGDLVMARFPSTKHVSGAAGALRALQTRSFAFLSTVVNADPTIAAHFGRKMTSAGFFQHEFMDFMAKYLAEAATEKAARRTVDAAQAAEREHLEKQVANLVKRLKDLQADRDEAHAVADALRSHLKKLDPATLQQIERAAMANATTSPPAR